MGLGSLDDNLTILGGARTGNVRIPIVPRTLYFGLLGTLLVVRRLYDTGRPDGPGGPKSLFIVAELDPHWCTVSHTCVFGLVLAVKGAAISTSEFHSCTIRQIESVNVNLFKFNFINWLKTVLAGRIR